MYNIDHGRNCVEIVVTSAISTAISTSFHCCGPFLVNRDIPGLYEFNNVCLTKQLSETCRKSVNHCEGNLQGIIYFTPNDDKTMRNPLRCVTCSAPLMHHWNETGRDEEEVGHKCGFTSTHVMYASDITDWNQCRLQPDAQSLTNLWGKQQVPATAESIRYYNEPVLSLNFQADNIGHSLFDHLLMYLPHWQKFKNTTYPFKGINSHSIEGCLSDTNNDWYCRILRSMNAFGNDAKELPPTSNTTLTCYKSLYVTEIAIQRGLKHKVLTKSLFDEFRDILFQSFNLDRGRNYHDEKQDEENKHTKLLLYAHKPSGRRVFEGMDGLVDTLSKQSKYQGVDFQMIEDFGSYSIIQQASLFNSADAAIMVHGAQMVNSIFSVDGTTFIELGCHIPTFIGNPRYMALLNGHHQSVQECGDDANDDDICVICDSSNKVYGNFTMKNTAFEALIDKVLLDLNHTT